MEDYPKSLSEFDARFSTEEDCSDYLFRLRWPDGFRCSRCGHAKAWSIGKSLFECGFCGYQCSVTAGTIFQDTHKPLTLWFRAMWWVTSQRTGMSAVSLQETLGLGSYRTAWAWLHKLRRAMVRPGRDRLSGRVEVDETYLGGLEEGLCGIQICNKALIVVAAEEDGRATGRIRMRRIDSASGKDLHGFVVEAIEKGSVVHTDGWRGYRGLNKKGYVHDVTPLRGKKKAAIELLPRVHRAISLLKRWLMGTHHGAVSHKHLDYYLDEFTFRFNRRTSRHRGKLFFRLVQQAAAGEPRPYRSLICGHEQQPRKPRPQHIVVT